MLPLCLGEGGLDSSGFFFKLVSSIVCTWRVGMGGNKEKKKKGPKEGSFLNCDQKKKVSAVNHDWIGHRLNRALK